MILRRIALPAVVASFLAATACAPDAPDAIASDASELRALVAGELLGAILDGESKTVFHSGQPRYRAYAFTAVKGAHVDAWVTSTTGDAMAFLTTETGAKIASNDDARANTTNAEILATVPADGTYHLVFREQDDQPATFTVSLELTPPTEPVPPVPGASCPIADQITSKPCGKCGIRETICLPAPELGPTAKRWSEYGMCINEAPDGCLPGEVQTTPIGCAAGTRTRTCTAFCGWSDFSACAP